MQPPSLYYIIYIWSMNGCAVDNTVLLFCVCDAMPFYVYALVLLSTTFNALRWNLFKETNSTSTHQMWSSRRETNWNSSKKSTFSPVYMLPCLAKTIATILLPRVPWLQDWQIIRFLDEQILLLLQNYFNYYVDELLNTFEYSVWTK